MKRFRLLAVGVFLFWGCASNSGVVAMGPDTFMVSRQLVGVMASSGKLLADAMAEANEYCGSKKLNMVPVSYQTSQLIPQAQLQFRCPERYLSGQVPLVFG